MLQCDSTGSIPIRASNCQWQLTSNGINIIKNELAGLRSYAWAGWEWCLERGLVVVRKNRRVSHRLGVWEALFPLRIRMLCGFCRVFGCGGWFNFRFGCNHSFLLALFSRASGTVGRLIPPVKFWVSKMASFRRASCC